MRILLLHQYFLEKDDAGGSRWNEMCKSWSKHGHEIHVIAGMMHPNGSNKREEYRGKYYCKKKHDEVTVHRTHVSETYNDGFLGRLWGYFSFMFSSLWYGWTKLPKGFDVVVVTSPPLFIGLSGYLISKLNRAPMVFEVRDLWPESAIDTGVVSNSFIIKISYMIESFIYSKSELINVLTPAFKDKLMYDKAVPESKLLFIPNAADFTLSEIVLKNFDRDKFREENKLRGKFVITYVGAHGVANHLEQVLHAAKALSDTNVVFLLIGKGMRKKFLVELSNEMGLDNVQFIDAVPKSEVFKYILASEMGASVLKKVEAFKTVYSNKTFDYMSCKTPILMAIDGVSRELVEKADAGTYVDPENTHEFDRIIRYYLENPDKLRKQGNNGYNYAKSNFDRLVLSDQYIAAIEQLTKEIG